MLPETLYTAARLFVRKETADLPATVDNDRILLTIEEADLTALIVQFVSDNISIIKS